MTTPFRLIRDTILQAFMDEVAGELYFPVQHENAPLAPPGPPKPYGRLTIVNGQTEPMALGSRFERTPILIYLQVFIAEEQGVGAAYRAAEKLSILSLRNLAAPRVTIRFRSVSAPQRVSTPQLVRQQGARVQFNVTLPADVDTDSA